MAADPEDLLALDVAVEMVEIVYGKLSRDTQEANSP